MDATAIHEDTLVKNLTFLHALTLRSAGLAKGGAEPASPDQEGADPELEEELDEQAHPGPVSRSGIVLSDPNRRDILMSESYTAADCPCCFRPLIVSWKDARPASDVLQDAFGCDPSDLYRFFDREEWLQRWELPLAMTWGTAADWRAIGGIWRATRARREGGFMSLADIERGSKCGDG